MAQIKRSIPLVLLSAFCILGAAIHESPAPTLASGQLDSGDTAWMLSASGLVLLMTPGLAFF